MMSQSHSNDLAHVREEFEKWRSQSSGRGRIPDRLWRLAIDLLDHVSTSVVCRELHLAAGDLKKRRLALAGAVDGAPSAPPFVELSAIDLAAPATRSKLRVGPESVEVDAELTRPDGARLVLHLRPTEWELVEALCTAFLRA